MEEECCVKDEFGHHQIEDFHFYREANCYFLNLVCKNVPNCSIPLRIDSTALSSWHQSGYCRLCNYSYSLQFVDKQTDQEWKDSVERRLKLLENQLKENNIVIQDLNVQLK